MTELVQTRDALAAARACEASAKAARAASSSGDGPEIKAARNFTSPTVALAKRGGDQRKLAGLSAIARRTSCPRVSALAWAICAKSL